MQAGGRYGMQTMDMSLAAHVKAGRISQQMAFERCHDAEELDRLIGSRGGLSAYGGAASSDVDSTTTALERRVRDAAASMGGM